MHSATLTGKIEKLKDKILFPDPEYLNLKNGWAFLLTHKKKSSVEYANSKIE